MNRAVTQEEDFPEAITWIKDNTPPPITSSSSAQQLLSKAAAIMTERGKQYDKPDGERSMAATVTAFNAITGQALTEAQGWLLLAVLKMVRDNQRAEPHVDSVEDFVTYASLYGEARLK